MDIAINATPEGEIRIQRRKISIEGIIKFDGDDVIPADIDIRSHVKDKGRETALMFAQKIPVDPNAGV